MPRWTLLLLLAACPRSPAVLDSDGELPSNLGSDRPATVIGPTDYDGTTALPVVFLLGGYWYYAHELDEWIALSDRVDAHNFLLVLPDGTVDDTGAPFWNATETCCDYYGSGVDDHAYLASLVAELEAEAAVDSERIAFMGHSNGAFMAYSMAFQAGGRWFESSRGRPSNLIFESPAGHIWARCHSRLEAKPNKSDKAVQDEHRSCGVES